MEYKAKDIFLLLVQRILICREQKLSGFLSIQTLYIAEYIINGDWRKNCKKKNEWGFA